MSATEVRTSGAERTMKAVNYRSPFKVRVEDVPMPNIEHPDDVIVKITTSGGLRQNAAILYQGSS
jgi:hypothetical protein